MSIRTAQSSLPRWAIHRRWIAGHIPRALRGWLLDAGSLTDRLKKACDGCFSVSRLDEGWQRPRPDERRALGMAPGAIGWVREVQLLCAGKPWVYARTVVPATTLTGAERQLACLGNRPLGAFLFADPGMQRGAVEIARLGPRNAMYAEATLGLEAMPGAIWGRRSVFRVGGKPLLVTEVFLPGLESARRSGA